MKIRTLFVTLLVSLTSLLSVVIAGAQGPQSDGAHASSVNAGTAFTYQGQLKNNGSPVNGLCDFQFGLFDALSAGTQISTTQTVSAVNVANGLFTTQIDFGANAVTGDARWLQIAVRCPAGGGSFTPLTPRQPLTPAPMALALPGLYTQQNATSPNVIGGYSGNVIDPAVVGGTISGGGSGANKNQVSANYSFVGGGLGNHAYGAEDVVGGGLNNHANGVESVVGGGFNNWNNGAEGFIGGGQSNFIDTLVLNATISGGSSNAARGTNATVGGGSSNQANDEYTTVSGGVSNVASKSYATVGGGLVNTASDGYATVSGGQVNTAARDHSFVGGGAGNNANMSYATISGGSGNVITSTAMYGTVPGGAGAQASHFGEFAYASGLFNTPGDAQTSVYVLRNSAAGANPSELFLDGINQSQRLTLADNRTVTFDILVVGRSASGTSAGYQFRGVIKKYAGTTSIVGGVGKTVIAEDDAAWDANVIADNANGALKITANGSGLLTSYWVASVRTVEFGY